MTWFNRNKTATITAETDTPIDIAPSLPPPEAEWVWVEGYKGTDKNMCCKDYQYILGATHSLPDEEEVELCKNGFHLCLNLNEVFNFYPIGEGNRFFKVQALVRKSDKKKYGTSDYWYAPDGSRYYVGNIYKIVAKSIIFTSELTIDEILANTDAVNLPDQYKQMAIDSSVLIAVTKYQMDTLIADGYSEPFAAYINGKKKFEVAHAVGTQKDLSMDMKVLTIFST